MPATSYFLHLADGREIPLEAEITLGREAPASLVLADKMVSRMHAAIWREGEAVFVRDLGSSNGTFVGGKKISGPARLGPGAGLRIGNTRLTVVAREDAAGSHGELPAGKPGIPAIGGMRAKPPAATGRRFPAWAWAACGVVGAGGAVCFVVAALALILPAILDRQRGEGAPPPEQVAETEAFTFGEPVITTLAADGSFAVDEHGVGAALTPGALDAGGTAQLRRSALGSSLLDELEPAFEVLTEAYSVAVEGELDAASAARLRFPAPSPDARLAVILDDRYGGVLEITPTDGSLTVETHVGALAGSGWGPSDAPQTARRYFVVVPSAGVGASGGTGAEAAPRSAPSSQGRLANCNLSPVGSACLTDGLVYVFYPDRQAPTARFAAVISTAHSLMTQYADLGVAAAVLDWQNPVHIVVGDYDEPQYSSITGNVYLNGPTVDGLAQGGSSFQATLAHELGHWIEDETYVMAGARGSPIDRWWFEVAAESLAFLVMPGAIQDNLVSYPMLREADDPRFGLQLAPFIWPGETEARYFHAIPVYVGMCGNPQACLFDQAGFLGAINEGVNPFAFGALDGAYHALLPDVARYLLGHPPTYANTGIPIPEGLRRGDLASETILVRENRGASTLEPYFDSRPPQLEVAGEVARIQAAIDRGGLYSFRLSNTGRSLGISTAGAPGLPAYLQVEPGTPFLFTIDNGEVHEGSGGRTTFIAPIHDALGFGMARLAAYAPDASHTLQAEVGYIDLSGDWVTDDFRVTNATDTCGEAEEAYAWTQDILLTAISAYGHFSRLETSGGEIPLTWVQDASFPSGDEAVTATATARVTMQDVQVEYAIHIPEPQRSQLFRGLFARWPGAPTAGLGAAAALPFAAAGVAALRWGPARRRAAVIAAVTLGILAVTLAGCEMLTGFWGDISGRYTFHGVEYLSQDFTLIEEGDELWRLTEGEGQMTLNMTTVTTDFETGEDTEQQCLVTITSQTNGLILLETAVTPEDIGFE